MWWTPATIPVLGTWSTMPAFWLGNPWYIDENYCTRTCATFIVHSHLCHILVFLVSRFRFGGGPQCSHVLLIYHPWTDRFGSISVNALFDCMIVPEQHARTHNISTVNSRLRHYRHATDATPALLMIPYAREGNKPVILDTFINLELVNTIWNSGRIIVSNSTASSTAS